jgi:hypothetical protein
VKNLVLPAAEEVESIWTNKFGFSTITQDEVRVCLCFMHACMPACAPTLCIIDKCLCCCIAADGIQEKLSDNGVSRVANAAKAGSQVPSCR